MRKPRRRELPEGKRRRQLRRTAARLKAWFETPGKFEAFVSPKSYGLYDYFLRTKRFDPIQIGDSLPAEIRPFQEHMTKELKRLMEEQQIVIPDADDNVRIDIQPKGNMCMARITDANYRKALEEIIEKHPESLKKFGDETPVGIDGQPIAILQPDEIRKVFFGKDHGDPRARQCKFCGNWVIDYVDPDWAKGRICLECETKYSPLDSNGNIIQ